jgi:hypothetical protein
MQPYRLTNCNYPMTACSTPSGRRTLLVSGNIANICDRKIQDKQKYGGNFGILRRIG